MKRFKPLIIGIAYLIFMIFFSHKDFKPIEDLFIPAGIGVDIEKIENNEIFYRYDYVVYNFNPKDVSNLIYSSTGRSLAEINRNLQNKMDKKLIIGTEEVFMFSSKLAESGIHATIDNALKRPTVQDMTKIVICEGEPKEIFSHEIEGYSTSIDYIGGLLENVTLDNFYSDNFKLIDVLVRLDVEGKSIVLPYIKLSEEGIIVSGTAVFKGEKMITNLNLEDSRFLNIIRENNSKGSMTIDYGNNKYIDYYIIMKRKIECKKEDDDYKFTINLDGICEIVTNTTDYRIFENTDFEKLLTEDLANKITEECKKILEETVRKYEVDCLGLGNYAAAKYGRRTNTDWDKVVSEAEIEIKVNLSIDKNGRGDF